MKPEKLARLTIENYIKENKLPKPPATLLGVDLIKAGVFVSIKTFDNNLRGCIGTIFPTRVTIQEEIINNAVAASTRDPRFDAIQRYELNNLKISVDVLHPPEPINSIVELDPEIFGIIIQNSKGNQALLLPNLDGVDTVEGQIMICRQKAGIMPTEPINIHKFKVERYSE